MGSVRTGVAVSSADGIFASPIGTVTSISEALEIVTEYEPIEIYVGLPLSLSGAHTKSTEMAITFGAELAKNIAIDVRFIDERLTTFTAATLMRSAGKNTKQSKSGIDAASATLILEQALAIEKSGRIPGSSVGEFS